MIKLKSNDGSIVSTTNATSGYSYRDSFCKDYNFKTINDLYENAHIIARIIDETGKYNNFDIDERIRKFVEENNINGEISEDLINKIKGKINEI